ncbi:uncharacterized protein [Diadema setosum]|uniref:uncharacterized protein n=1 Tax=Diadema setosum TaxID=31175 RepID=UPI003B3B6338
MPQGRYRSRSRSPHKKGRRRRSSGSNYSRSYSRSRSRSRSRSMSGDKHYRHKERSSRRSPPVMSIPYRSSKQSSSHDRRRSFESRSRRRSRSHSRSASSSPRSHRSHVKKESSNYALDSSKVLGGNFSDIPGLDFIGRNNDRIKKKSFSPQQDHKSQQDLDMRLRELEAQSSSGSRSRGLDDQSKSSQREYYGSASLTEQGYQQQSKGSQQKYESKSYSKERAMSPQKGRYREQRKDFGIRVEVKRKPSPKRRKFDASLVIIPRRKDEGLRPIFDRPEIIARTLEDDPELYPEKYERFACWRKSPEGDRRKRKDGRSLSKERDERPRKHRNSHTKEKIRSQSPEQLLPRETTVVMKPFTAFEKYEQLLRNRSSSLQEDNQFLMQRSQDFNQHSHHPATSTSSSFNMDLGLDSMLSINSDLRHDLEVRRQLLALEEEKQMQSSQFTVNPLDRLSSGGFSVDRREVSSDRRPVRERLGGVDSGGISIDDPKPDFRKEVEELQRLDPSAEPIRGSFYEHDDRGKRSPSMEKLHRPPTRGRFIHRTPYRGMRGRGFYRGSFPYRGRGFSRGFRGSGYVPRGYTRGTRGTYRPYGSTFGSAWKHDKFEDKEKDKSSKKDKKDKEKKSKSSEKKKAKKSSKSSPERSKSKSKRESKQKI